MRVEANISVSPTEKFGTKVEVKNLNSFRSVEKAILYGIDRHIRLLEKGEKIVQETRGWDEDKQVTFSQRLKEDSHDYRYFPDPDLPKLHISEIPEFSAENISKEMPELPWQKRERYAKEFELKSDDVELFVNNFSYAVFFEQTVQNLGGDKKKIKLASNYICSDYVGLLRNDPAHVGLSEMPINKIKPEAIAEIVTMISESKLTSRSAKDILAIIYKEGGKPAEIAEKHGLLQKNDEGELKKIMTEIVANNPKVVADYRAGKEAALMSLVGQGMKATKGSANPELLKKIALELVS